MHFYSGVDIEIIRLVEQSHLPVSRTLEKIGVSRPAFYRWYDRYRRFGEHGLHNHRAGPSRTWNRIPDVVRGQIVGIALDRPDLRPRELAVTFTDERGYFVSEASAYLVLKAHDLIAGPAFTAIKAADVSTDCPTFIEVFWYSA